MRTLIIGLGNPILSDDGIGVRIAEALREQLPDNFADDIAESSLGGLSLMESMIGYERVILIDAMLDPTLPPGTFRRMDLSDLEDSRPTQHSASPHDANLVTAIRAGKQMGLVLPNEVIIYAIGVEKVSDFSDQLTPEVASVIPQIIAFIMDDLKQPRS